MPSHPISPELLERPSAPVRDLPPRKKTPNPRSIEGGEDDGAEDVAAGGAQHQLRAPSGGATSPGGARPWCGGGADAPASPRHGGGGAAPPASQQRGRGGLPRLREPRAGARRLLAGQEERLARRCVPAPRTPPRR